MLNNYHNTGGGQIHGVGLDMALIAENSVYDEEDQLFTDKQKLATAMEMSAAQTLVEELKTHGGNFKR